MRKFPPAPKTKKRNLLKFKISTDFCNAPWDSDYKILFLPSRYAKSSALANQCNFVLMIEKVAASTAANSNKCLESRMPNLAKMYHFACGAKWKGGNHSVSEDCPFSKCHWHAALKVYFLYFQPVREQMSSTLNLNNHYNCLYIVPFAIYFSIA